MMTTAQAANNTILFAGNYWRVTHMAHNFDDKPMCIMHSQLSFTNSTTGNSTVGSVMIKSIKGNLNPSIQLSKDWHFPSDIQVPFSVDFDNVRREFVGVSKNNPVKSKVSVIMADVSADDDNNGWLEAFASSETMTITFRTGNEPKWSVKMAGSREALKSFRSCIKSLEKDTSPVPQATSPVPEVPDASSQPVPTNPVKTVPTKRPKGDSI
jgi:hypothetical protein